MSATWSQSAFLKPQSNSAGMRFGMSLAVDSFQLAVGSAVPEAVWICPYDAPGAHWWFESAHLTTGSPTGFGDVVLLPHRSWGTVGHYFIAVAAPRSGVGGRIYFPGPIAGNPLTLFASNSRSNDLFGASMAYGGTTGQTIAVGAPGESSSATGINGNRADTSAPFAGAVYVH
jgi:hypothetical protein